MSAHVLHESIDAGNVCKVEKLLDAGHDLEYVDWIYDCTPLVQAAQSPKNLEMVQMLLERGADVNARETFMNVTALYFASFYQCMEIMDVLIAHGADVNAVDEYGFTILHACAMFGRTHSVRKLIAAGADVEAVVGKENALSLAAEHRYIETVRILAPLTVNRATAFSRVNDDKIFDVLLAASGVRARPINTCTLQAKLRGKRACVHHSFPYLRVFVLLLCLIRYFVAI